MAVLSRREFIIGSTGLALMGAGTSSLLAAQTTLVQEGKSDYGIYVRPGAPLAATRGAQELQTFIAQISGATLPFVTDADINSSHGNKPLIVIESAPLAEEEYRLRVKSGRITIQGGGKRGAIYGCYAFLEDVLGCRWYTQKISKIPSSPTIVLEDLDRREKPAFEYREPYYWEAFDRDWAVRNRTNGNAQHLDDSVGGRVQYGPFVHTFNLLVPPATYFATHPEYFSLIDGQRRAGAYQLCLTNPDVLQIAIAQVRQWIHDLPDATIFSVSQNDNNNRCECDACRAVEQEEGAPSGLVLRFVNGVAKAIGQDYPHVLIDTLAYHWTEVPPLHVRPLPNVRIRLAPITACIAHALDECSENTRSYNNLKAWAAITDQLYLWLYCTNFHYYLQPIPDLHEIATDLPLVRKNGVVGVFYEGDYAQGGGGELAELKAYVMAKLMWNPRRPVEPLIADYLSGVYGPAAPYIGQWLDSLQEAVKDMGAHAHIYDPPTAPYLSNALIKKGVTLFDAAETAAGLNPTALDQVQRARLSLEFVQAEQCAQDDPARGALMGRVIEKIRKYGITQIREGQPVDLTLALLNI